MTTATAHPVETTRQRINRLSTRALQAERELAEVRRLHQAELDACVETTPCYYGGCLAQPGEPCRTVDGEPLERPHQDRWSRHYWRDDVGQGS